MILPPPDGAFRWRETPFGPALVCGPLEPLARHFFTTRSWRLGSRTADATLEAWAEIAGAAGVPADRLVRVRQVHGADVAVHRGGPGALQTADIIVSADPSDALAVQAADCVPLLLADSRTGAFAAAHAGWRGLAAGVPGGAVAALARAFGSRADDLVAAAGPSIGACCYEVGGDVRERFEAAGFAAADLARWFHARPQPTSANPSMPGVPAASEGPRQHHWYFDAWAAVRDQLEAAGVGPRRIFVAALCTASHPDVGCSYRRDGGAAGRMAAAIRRRSPRP